MLMCLCLLCGVVQEEECDEEELLEGEDLDLECC